MLLSAFMGSEVTFPNRLLALSREHHRLTVPSQWREGGYLLYSALRGATKLPRVLLKKEVGSRRNVFVRWLDGLLNLEENFPREVTSLSLSELRDYFDGQIPRLELLFESSYGNISFLEAVVLSYLVQLWKPKNIFEVGTYDGFSTFHLAANSPPECLTYTLNLEPETNFSDFQNIYQASDYHGDRLTHETMKQRGVGKWYRQSRYKEKVIQLYGNSLTYPFEKYIGKMDVCFIDGGHSLNHVESDTLNAFRMVKPGGVVIWHDYNVQHGDIYRFLSRLARQRPLFRVCDTRLAFSVVSG